MLAPIVLVLALAGPVGDPPPPPTGKPPARELFTPPPEPSRFAESAAAAAASAAGGALGGGGGLVLAGAVLWSSTQTELGSRVSVAVLAAGLAVVTPFAAAWLAGAGALLALGRWQAQDWQSMSICVVGGLCGLFVVPSLLFCGANPFAMALAAVGSSRREPFWRAATRSEAFPPIVGAAVGTVLVGLLGGVGARLMNPGPIAFSDPEPWLPIVAGVTIGAAVGGALGGGVGGAVSPTWAGVRE